MDSAEPSQPTARDRLTLTLASIIAAHLVSPLDDREFQGMRSPRFEAAMSRSLTVANALIVRYYRNNFDRI